MPDDTNRRSKEAGAASDRSAREVGSAAEQKNGPAASGKRTDDQIFRDRQADLQRRIDELEDDPERGGYRKLLQVSQKALGNIYNGYQQGGQAYPGLYKDIKTLLLLHEVDQRQRGAAPSSLIPREGGLDIEKLMKGGRINDKEITSMLKQLPFGNVLDKIYKSATTENSMLGKMMRSVATHYGVRDIYDATVKDLQAQRKKAAEEKAAQKNSTKEKTRENTNGREKTRQNSSGERARSNSAAKNPSSASRGARPGAAPKGGLSSGAAGGMKAPKVDVPKISAPKLDVPKIKLPFM